MKANKLVARYLTKRASGAPPSKEYGPKGKFLLWLSGSDATHEGFLKELESKMAGLSLGVATQRAIKELKDHVGYYLEAMVSRTEVNNLKDMVVAALIDEMKTGGREVSKPDGITKLDLDISYTLPSDRDAWEMRDGPTSITVEIWGIDAHVDGQEIKEDHLSFAVGTFDSMITERQSAEMEMAEEILTWVSYPIRDDAARKHKLKGMIAEKLHKDNVVDEINAKLKEFQESRKKRFT